MNLYLDSRRKLSLIEQAGAVEIISANGSLTIYVEPQISSTTIFLVALFVAAIDTSCEVRIQAPLNQLSNLATLWLGVALGEQPDQVHARLQSLPGYNRDHISKFTWNYLWPSIPQEPSNLPTNSV